MFFDLVRRNSRRSRKENGIFFVSLVVTIVAFYIILSLESQDVMVFLRKMESDAVSKLMGMIPVFYVVSLVLLFFLVYYASRYQLERRSHEFGMYLMLGMRRSGIFAMLMLEDLWSSFCALAVGLPIAVLLSELISLVTARLVGLGILGHHFTFSIQAAALTAAGFFLIKILALGVLSGKIAAKEVGQLLTEGRAEKKVRGKPALAVGLAGLLAIVAAYTLGITGQAWESLVSMGFAVALGVIGTFLFFRGSGSWIEGMLQRKRKKTGLSVFNLRQLQENLWLRSGSLAVTSLLVLLALCCFGYGVSVGFSSTERESHIVDYTFQGSEKQIRKELEKPELSAYLKEVFEVKTGSLYAGQGEDGKELRQFDARELVKAVRQEKDSEEKQILLNNLQYFTSPYVISLSGYNRVLACAGKDPIKLRDGEAAMYHGNRGSGKLTHQLEKAVKTCPVLKIDGESYRLNGDIYGENLVVDRSISIDYGLIVSDAAFDALLKETGFSSYWNAVLKEQPVKENGLMQTIARVNKILDGTPLSYESYLQNIGRQLFFVVASSYTTLYLALIFLIIANTVLAVQFLMQQQKAGKRYRILVNLGSGYRSLCQSARTQIKWYFGFPVAVAAGGSIFGIQTLFSGLLTTAAKGQGHQMLLIALALIIVLCVVECCYVAAVMRLSDRHLLEYMRPEREE